MRLGAKGANRPLNLSLVGDYPRHHLFAAARASYAIIRALRGLTRIVRSVSLRNDLDLCRSRPLLSVGRVEADAGPLDWQNGANDIANGKVTIDPRLVCDEAETLFSREPLDSTTHDENLLR